MMRTIRAVYEAGVLRPLKKLRLREHQPVLIAVLPLHDDISSLQIADAAAHSNSFDFLTAPAEDLYYVTDGTPI